MTELIIRRGRGAGNNIERRCCDCRFTRRAVNWWCMNDGAFKYRRTRMPSACKCAFWKSARGYTDLRWSEKAIYWLGGGFKIDPYKAPKETGEAL